MTDRESMASQSEHETASVRPKETDNEAKEDSAGGDVGNSEPERNAQRRLRPPTRRLPSQQDRQRPHNNGYRPRQFGNSRGSNQNERPAGRDRGNPPEDVAATRELRNKLVEKLGRQGINPFNSYLKNQVELARFKTTSDFLSRCLALSVLPTQYRLSNSQVQNTLYMRRLLERFSSQVMRAELRYSQKRCFQIERLLNARVDSLKEVYDEELFTEIMALVDKVHKRRYDEFLKSRNEALQALIEEYKISPEEVSEAEATVNRNEEARRQRREEAEQQPKQSAEPNDASGLSNEPRIARRGPRRQNFRQPKPIPKDD